MLMPKYCLNEISDVLAKEMIRQMLNKDPSARPSLREVQNSPYFWSEQQKVEHLKFVLRGPRGQGTGFSIVFSFSLDLYLCVFVL